MPPVLRYVLMFNVCRRIRLTHASATFQQLTDNEITPARNSAAVFRLTPGRHKRNLRQWTRTTPVCRSKGSASALDDT
jgi:hypothetical protein